MAFIVVNPATGQRIARHAEHPAAEVERRLERAHRAARAWREVSPTERVAPLPRLATALRAAAEELAQLATAEMGKPITQSRSEVEKCATLCAYLAREAPAQLADQIPAGAPAGARITCEPLGPILAVMPWNFPFWQAIRAALPALVAGNPVLLKPAPNVPGCALALERIFRAAGFPAGLFQILLIGTAPIPRLIRDPRIAAVTLTGSTRAGRAVAAVAGDALKPGVFELGGSDPALVLEDADVDHAAEVAATSRLLNSGQSCICAKRFIVVRSRLREFTDAFVDRLLARRVGDPRDPGTDVGPLARADLRTGLHRQVGRSLRAGARLLAGGTLPAGPGYFYPITVLAGVAPGNAAADEELFGPVAAIMTARNEAEAVRLANASTFGLGASVFTRDTGRARHVAARLDAGSVYVNDFVRSTPELPFGGIKASGHGRELGRWGTQAFVNVKTIVGA